MDKAKATMIKGRDFSPQEFQILGILLQHPDLIDEVADRLQPHHFSHPEAQAIYQTLLNQYQEKGELSRTRLYIKLEQEGVVKEPDKILNRLTAGFVAPAELEPTIEILRNNYQRQQLINTALKIQEMASMEMDLELEDLQARAQELIMAATTESKIDQHIFTMEEVLLQAYESFMDRKNKRVDTGLRTGFISLDKIFGGFKRGHLIVLAASTSVGKSAFALNIAHNILKRDVPVGIISLEMSAQEIIDRIIISEAQINGWRYSQGETAEAEDERISQAIDNLYRLPLRISDERGLTVAQIRARLRKFNAQFKGLGLAIIDYLQMVQLSQDSYKQGNIARAVGENVLQLRNLASELNIPILLISQISRSFKARKDQRPILSDLRDSGNIEEIADGVILLYRHAHTSVGAREEAKLEGRERDTEIIVAKNRTGATGSTVFYFEEEHINFVDPENMSLERSMPVET